MGLSCPVLVAAWQQTQKVTVSKLDHGLNLTCIMTAPSPRL